MRDLYLRHLKSQTQKPKITNLKIAYREIKIPKSKNPKSLNSEKSPKKKMKHGGKELWRMEEAGNAACDLRRVIRG